MARVEGKVAIITGAARGLGRAFALRLAEEGADIIALDVDRPVAGVSYALGSHDDLDETGAMITALGRRVVLGRADVRDRQALKDILRGAVGTLGRLDIVCANAGIFTGGPLEEV